MIGEKYLNRIISEIPDNSTIELAKLCENGHEEAIVEFGTCMCKYGYHRGAIDACVGCSIGVVVGGLLCIGIGIGIEHIKQNKHTKNQNEES